MPLPDTIEIIPLAGNIRADISVPGSKSITNRALTLAALASGRTTLTGALWSEDTQVMVACLKKLGFEVRVKRDPDEPSNRTITVRGHGGKIPRGGTETKPLELFVGNAGTTARFMAAMVCLGNGVVRMTGVPRMHERPQAALFQALRQLGYRIDSANDKFPAIIRGAGSRKGNCEVSIEESSQFASALMLSALIGKWKIKVIGDNAEESPYVAMTARLIKAFPRHGGAFEIEADASSGSYFFGMAELLRRAHVKNSVTLKHWPKTKWQIDTEFRKFHPLPKLISRLDHLGDSIMTAIVMAPFEKRAVRFTDLGRLRVQECDRVSALATELGKCGAKVIEVGDELEVFPSALHGAEIETYNDHRMAMCFAVLGLVIPGMKIMNPACVKKTFPDFFQKLAAPPPAGLGAQIIDAKSSKRLRGKALFAE